MVVSNCDAIFELEFFLQTQSALEPLPTLLRIAHGQTKMAHFSKREWNLHLDRERLGLFLLGTVSGNERFHEAQIEILQGVPRRLAQAAGASLQLRTDIGKPDAANH